MSVYVCVDNINEVVNTFRNVFKKWHMFYALLSNSFYKLKDEEESFSAHITSKMLFMKL